MEWAEDEMMTDNIGIMTWMMLVLDFFTGLLNIFNQNG